jgi:hypothetical protein
MGTDALWHDRFGPFGNTVLRSHFKITANPRSRVINKTLHGVSIQRRTPAIFQPRHLPPAPLINLYVHVGHPGIGNEHHL